MITLKRPRRRLFGARGRRLGQFDEVLDFGGGGFDIGVDSFDAGSFDFANDISFDDWGAADFGSVDFGSADVFGDESLDTLDLGFDPYAASGIDMSDTTFDFGSDFNLEDYSGGFGDTNFDGMDNWSLGEDAIGFNGAYSDLVPADSAAFDDMSQYFDAPTELSEMEIAEPGFAPDWGSVPTPGSDIFSTISSIPIGSVAQVATLVLLLRRSRGRSGQ